MENEIWKDIPGYVGYYQVSSLGNVRALDRIIITKKGQRFLRGKKVNQNPTTGGYLGVALSKNSNSKTRRVHQLVAMAFFNHTPNGHKLVVDHIDNNRANNKLSNLQLITQKENLTKDPREGSRVVSKSAYQRLAIAFRKAKKHNQDLVECLQEYKHFDENEEVGVPDCIKEKAEELLNNIS